MIKDKLKPGDYIMYVGKYKTNNETWCRVESVQYNEARPFLCRVVFDKSYGDMMEVNTTEWIVQKDYGKFVSFNAKNIPGDV
jgi:hypothetical protein